MAVEGQEILPRGVKGFSMEISWWIFFCFGVVYKLYMIYAIYRYNLIIYCISIFLFLEQIVKALTCLVAPSSLFFKRKNEVC